MNWGSFLTSIRKKWRPHESTIVGIDIGTTKIAAAVVSFNSGSPKILGMACVPFNGVNWAESNKIAITSAAINHVLGIVRKKSACLARSAVVGISGMSSGRNSIGAVRVKRQILREDVQRAVNAAADMKVPEDSVIIEHVVNSFSLDGIEGIKNPLDITYSSLEALTHTIICKRSVLEIVSASCKQAGLNARQIKVSEIAATSLLLTQEDKKHGVCLLDIGGEYTSMLVFVSGALQYSASVPWGGNYLTSCIGLGLGLNKADAELVKIDFSTNGAANISADRFKAIRELLDERLRELSILINCELDKKELKDALGAGLVLTGGTSNLPGLPEIFEHELALPVRHAEFEKVTWLENVSLDYASAIGLAIAEHSDVVEFRVKENAHVRSH